MALLDDYIKDLAPLVNLDCGTCNTAGVTRAAEIMKGYFCLLYTSDAADE